MDYVGLIIHVSHGHDYRISSQTLTVEFVLVVVLRREESLIEGSRRRTSISFNRCIYKADSYRSAVPSQTKYNETTASYTCTEKTPITLAP